MKIYADTNFYTNLLLQLSHSADARALYDQHRAHAEHPIPVTSLLELEFLNAVERYVFESRHGGQWRVTPEGAMLASAAFDGVIEVHVDFEQRALSFAGLKNFFELMVQRHTAKWGFRTYDILHVASALVLGCDTFWTFDAKAKKLAQLEGLATN